MMTEIRLMRLDAMTADEELGEFLREFSLPGLSAPHGYVKDSQLTFYTNPASIHITGAVYQFAGWVDWFNLHTDEVTTFAVEVNLDSDGHQLHGGTFVENEEDRIPSWVSAEI